MNTVSQCQTSKMELFVKPVNGFILDVWQGFEYTSAYTFLKIFELLMHAFHPFSFWLKIERKIKITFFMRVLSDIASSYIFRPSKVTEHVTSRVSGGEFRTKLKKFNRNDNSNPNSKFFVFIIIFAALSFLRLTHSWFFIWGGNVS